YHHDVTGDGKKETITLYGVLSNHYYFDQIWAELIIDGKKEKINFPGGYEPKLQFVDLNHDGVDDILYSSATGGSGGLYNFALYSSKGGHVEEIAMPSPMEITGEFQNKFKAIVHIPTFKKPIVVNLSERKEDYIRL